MIKINKAKVIKALVVIALVIGFITVPSYILKKTQQVDNKTQLTVREMLISIEKDQSREAAQLRALIKSSLSDGKLMLSEYEDIGKAYSSYRAKHAVGH